MTAELATIEPVPALTIDVVGSAVPHGKAVKKVSPHGSTAVTDATTRCGISRHTAVAGNRNSDHPAGPELAGQIAGVDKAHRSRQQVEAAIGRRWRTGNRRRYLGAGPRVGCAPRWHDGNLIQRVADELTHRRRGLAAEMDSVGREPTRWHSRTERRPVRQHQFGIVAAAQHRIAFAVARRVPRSSGLAIGEPDDVSDALLAGLGDHHVDCRADPELARGRIVVAGGHHQGTVSTARPWRAARRLRSSAPILAESGSSS